MKITHTISKYLATGNYNAYEINMNVNNSCKCKSHYLILENSYFSRIKLT